MENKIVTPDTNVQSERPNEQEVKILEELQKIETKEGSWVFSKEHGIVWKPYPKDEMGGGGPAIPTETPPGIVAEFVEWGKVFDFDHLPENAVVLIKLNINDPLRVQMMQRAIAKQVLEPRVETLKSKRICVLFMHKDDDISVMSEEDMQQAGWEKKDKKRIITLS